MEVILPGLKFNLTTGLTAAVLDIFLLFTALLFQFRRSYFNSSWIKKKKREEKKLKSPLQQGETIELFPGNDYCSQRASTPHVNGIWEHSITQGAHHNHHCWGGTPGNHTQHCWQRFLGGFIQQLSPHLVLALLCWPWMILAHHS